MPHDGIPFPLPKRTWRGVSGTSRQYPEDPKYEEYQYFIPCKEGDIRAPSNMIPSGEWASYGGITDDSFYVARWEAIAVQTSSIFYGIRIDSTSARGITGGQTCCCWTGMSRPALCATELCHWRKPAAAGIMATIRTPTTSITSKDKTNRQINKPLQIPKPKKTIK